MITLFGPAGEKLAVREVATGGRDSAKVSLVAKSSGIYRTEVRSTKGRRDGGLYFIWLEEPRPITPQRSAPYSRS